MAGKDKVENEEIPGKADDQVDDKTQNAGQDEPPKDIRGAIRHAMKEVAEKEANESEDTESDTKPNRSARRKDSVRDSVSDAVSSDDGAADNNRKRADGVRKVVSKSTEAPEDDEVAEETEIQSADAKAGEKEEKIEPVGFWKSKSKTWEKLPAEAKKEILAREKEVSDGFAQVSERFKPFGEIERVLTPRAQSIQAMGVTPAQLIDRLFQWLDGLSHNNMAVRVNSFKELAKQSGIKLGQLTPKADDADLDLTDEDLKGQSNQAPEWFEQYSNQVNGQINALTNAYTAQQRQTADAFVGNWAKDKPYFEQVRQLMFKLSTPGPNGEPAVVPFKNGQVDLDGAYEAAIKLHPEVAAQIQQDAAKKAEEEAAAKAAKDAKERAARLAKAKAASSSIRPGAPGMASTPAGQRPNLNGTGNNRPSVRDSIRAALDEHRG